MILSQICRVFDYSAFNLCYFSTVSFDHTIEISQTDSNRIFAGGSFCFEVDLLDPVSSSRKLLDKYLYESEKKEKKGYFVLGLYGHIRTFHLYESSVTRILPKMDR